MYLLQHTRIFFWIHHFHYSLVLCQKWFGFNPHRTGKCSWLLYYYWCYQVCKGSSYAPIDPNKPKLWTNFPNIKNKPRTVGSTFEFQVGLSKLSKILIKNGLWPNSNPFHKWFRLLTKSAHMLKKRFNKIL